MDGGVTPQPVLLKPTPGAVMDTNMWKAKVLHHGRAGLYKTTGAALSNRLFNCVTCVQEE